MNLNTWFKSPVTDRQWMSQVFSDKESAWEDIGYEKPKSKEGNNEDNNRDPESRNT